MAGWRIDSYVRLPAELLIFNLFFLFQVSFLENCIWKKKKLMCHVKLTLTSLIMTSPEIYLYLSFANKWVSIDVKLHLTASPQNPLHFFFFFPSTVLLNWAGMTNFHSRGNNLYICYFYLESIYKISLMLRKVWTFKNKITKKLPSIISIKVNLNKKKKKKAEWDFQSAVNIYIYIYICCVQK